MNEKLILKYKELISSVNKEYSSIITPFYYKIEDILKQIFNDLDTDYISVENNGSFNIMTVIFDDITDAPLPIEIIGLTIKYGEVKVVSNTKEKFDLRKININSQFIILLTILYRNIISNKK